MGLSSSTYSIFDGPISRLHKRGDENITPFQVTEVTWIQTNTFHRNPRLWGRSLALILRHVSGWICFDIIEYIVISEATADASAATGGLLIAIPVLARVFFLLISTHLVSHLTMEGSRQLRGSSVSLGGLIHSWKISRVEFQYLYRNPAPWLLTFRLALKFTILSPIPCSCIGETSDIIYVCQALKPFVA